MSGTAVQEGNRQGTSPDINAEASIWRKAFITVLSAVVVIIAVSLLIYGWDYYFLGLAERPFSPKHMDLKPSGRIGLRLGITGFILFAMVYLYPLRKHWPALGRIGKTKNWFDFHVLLGLSAPVLVTFHSAFKIQGFAGMAYWTMLALVVSGIIGRYFYAQIPRNISAAEMSFNEMQDLKTALVSELKKQRVIPISQIEDLFSLPDAREVQSMSMTGALIRMIVLDMLRPFKVWSLRRRGMKAGGRSAFLGGIIRSGNAGLESAIELTSRQAALSKRILFLAKTQRVFHGWHVIHRPFGISFALFVLIHVAVVTWLGYF